MKQTAGIHHITAIVGHPQENVDFYAGVLGLRMVKKTINFDDPGTYHLYFGNEGGEPGTIITFFPWAKGRTGKVGAGQVSVTSYAVPSGSMPFWEKRLKDYGIATEKTVRFGETYLQFSDPHGLQLELVERDTGKTNSWTFNGVTPDTAIQGFAGAILSSAAPEQTAEHMETVMGLEKIGEANGLIRFQSQAEVGNVIEISTTVEESGVMGVGTVHHIAFRAKDNPDHLDWQKHVRAHGFSVTEVRDRNYFNAIYFKEPGHVLFEIATDPPGFAHDESPETMETMGQALKLPEQYEDQREKLNEWLIPIEVRESDK